MNLGRMVEESKSVRIIFIKAAREYFEQGSFNTLAFGEIKPYSGSLKDGRLDLIYYRDPGLEVGDQFPVWTLR